MIFGFMQIAFVPVFRRRLSAATACALCGLIACAGCRVPQSVRTSDRYARGVVFILPGIEGRSVWNRNIALGLDEGGVGSAIEVYDWTSGLPGTFVYNLANLERNRRQARRLADRILAYRDRYPGSPVHLLGHSAGGGIAVLALEALPPGRQIDQAILLAPALSPDHDLSTALRRTRHGICNFYSTRDVSFLRVGTSLFGPVDRDFGTSAGAVGFKLPDGLSEADRELYAARLRQVRWNPRMKEVGASGSHLGWASRKFASDYLAPLIQHNEAARPLPAAYFK
ncbi:MAG: alpha/beta fold hydrolase [Phycisphaerae bacterium]